MWEDYVKKYEAITVKSRELYKRALKVTPGGVSHNIRFFPPYPFYTIKARGSKIWDADGNVYTDYWMGHMALILGHSPEPVVTRIREQIENGFHFGTVNPYALELAEAIQRNLPSAEMVRLGCSGTEATMYAVRLARAYTGKRIVVKAEGGWHGGNPILHKAVSAPYDKPDSLGILEDEQRFTRTIPVNDIEGSRLILRGCGDDLACVIIEPVLGSGCIPLDKNYLLFLREECDRYNAVLIFDEVITGFRLGISSAQGFYRVKPDITTLGKIIGGGFPIGAVAGLSEILKLADLTSGHKWERCWIGGGTFSCNPMSSIAGLATIEFLEENANQVYSKINKLGDEARRSIDKTLNGLKGLNVKTTGIGSLLLTHFLKEEGHIKSPRDRLKKTDLEIQRNFYIALITHGVFFLPGHAGAISYAHTEEDIKRMIEAVEKIAEGI